MSDLIDTEAVIYHLKQYILTVKMQGLLCYIEDTAHWEIKIIVHASNDIEIHFINNPEGWGLGFSMKSGEYKIAKNKPCVIRNKKYVL